MMYWRCFLVASLYWFSQLTFAGTPLVEFIQKPTAQQLVVPGQNNIIFYTLRNNTGVTFPLTVTTSTPLVREYAVGNTCGAQIMAHSICVIPFIFSAPAASQTINAEISIDYQGRIPLTDRIAYLVNANIPCRLLSINDFQTQFCQQQYQNFLYFTPNVFNIFNQNVLNGQSIGGTVGIYKHTTVRDAICYLSCGLRALNGTPPDQQTIFELASVTKTFTASIFGKKVFLNEVNPLAAVDASLPTGTWMGESYNLHPNMQPVTFQQLATFSGGVCFSDAPNVVITDPYIQKQADFVRDINLLDRTSATCLGTGANVAPEYGLANLLPSHNRYSNSSVGLLAQILMHLDGYTTLDQTDFNNWICQHIAVPLQMTRTSACLPNEATSDTCMPAISQCDKANWQTAEYASGYHLSNNSYVLGLPFPYVPWAGAGVLRSNAEDMVKYLQANLGVTTSVSPDVTTLLQGMIIAHTSNLYLPLPVGTPRRNIGSQSPLLGGQGYAWVCDPDSTNPFAICGKIGGHENFRSFVGFSKFKQYGIVILLNTGDLGTNGSLAAPIPSVATMGVNMIKAAT